MEQSIKTKDAPRPAPAGRCSSMLIGMPMGYLAMMGLCAATLAADVRVTRGPYLQSGTPTNVIVRWRTDVPCDSRIIFGTNAFSGQVAFSRTIGTNHAIRLTGLRPDTRYHYSVGTMQSMLAGGPDYSFVTAPVWPKPTRIWVIGDSGTGDENAAAVRDGYDSFAGNRPADLWLMLGDNAYYLGTDEEYQLDLFDMYPRHLRQTVVWPTIGNHEVWDGIGIGTNTFPYLENFTLPTEGQAGGVSSGTERYYSFDHGNIHFISLDSMSSDRSPGSPMLNWLEADLADTAKDWIIAFWHHPPYSMGTHHSDHDVESIEMRRFAVPILEHYGVDLVLSGHSHVYERSFLINGHYGFSTNFSSAMMLDGGLGRTNLGGPYRKPAGGIGAHQGTLYAVCGCSGEGGYFSFPRHPIMATNLSGYGSMVLDVDGDRLEGKFIRQDGSVEDYFTLVKDMPGTNVAPVLTIHRANTGALQLTWPTSRAGFRIEARNAFGDSSTWHNLFVTRTVIARRNVVNLPLQTNQQVFRLCWEP